MVQAVQRELKARHQRIQAEKLPERFCDDDGASWTPLTGALTVKS